MSKYMALMANHHKLMAKEWCSAAGYSGNPKNRSEEWVCGGRRGKGRYATVRGRVPLEATGTYARSAEAARGEEA